MKSSNLAIRNMAVILGAILFVFLCIFSFLYFSPQVEPEDITKAIKDGSKDKLNISYEATAVVKFKGVTERKEGDSVTYFMNFQAADNESEKFYLKTTGDSSDYKKFKDVKNIEIYKSKGLSYKRYYGVIKGEAYDIVFEVK